MTKNRFNAKKVLMSAITAVVFSFVFATSANASNPNDAKQNGTEIRQPSNDNEQEKMPEDMDILSYILQTIFGVRV